VIAAAALTLTLIESYLVIGGAVLLLGFGGSRWTAPIAEGYFSYVIRVGTRLLFFYLVLGIGVQIAIQWQTAILAACHPVSTALPWYTTYGMPPKSIMTTVCSNVVPVHAMLNLTAMSIVFLIVTLAVPYTAANIVSGTVGLALSHAFEAAYVAQTVVRPITSALQTGFGKVAQIAKSDNSNEAPGWVNAMDSGRRTQPLGNLASDGGQRLSAPSVVRGTSIMPPRVPNTTPMNPKTASYGSGNSTTAMGKATAKT
jgi:type IV secretion system protein TrbL